jgi:hypothetical protein
VVEASRVNASKIESSFRRFPCPYLKLKTEHAGLGILRLHAQHNLPVAVVRWRFHQIQQDRRSRSGLLNRAGISGGSGELDPFCFTRMDMISTASTSILRPAQINLLEDDAISLHSEVQNI